jgi:uncharacterized protein (TIGR02598 family)
MNWRRWSKEAFSLVEVTLALGVMAFCLIAVFGLLPVGLSSNQAAIQQTGAVDLLIALDTDLRSTLKTATSSPRFSISIPGGALLYFRENGVPDSQTNSRYRVLVSFIAPSNRMATTGRILITWPAQQDDPQKARGSVDEFVALDRN